MGIEILSIETLVLLIKWAAFIFAFIIGLFMFGFLIVNSTKINPNETWLLKLIQKQFAALICMPIGLASALCIVIMFDVIQKEEIKISAFGVKFEGAAGPIILWIFCFLAIATAIRMLWVKNGLEKSTIREKLHEEENIDNPTQLSIKKTNQANPADTKSRATD